MKRFAYIIMLHAVKRRFGTDWENLPWRGDMAEFLWPEHDSFFGVIIYASWIVAAVLGFVREGFIGLWIGVASIVPAVIIWSVIAHVIARLSIEYWNDLN